MVKPKLTSSQKKDVIIACDFSNEKELWNFLAKFKKQKPFIKIGYEMFYAYGLPLIKSLKQKGYKVFLDLKLLDIPNTMEKAFVSLCKLKVEFITIHITDVDAYKRILMITNKYPHLLPLCVLKLSSTKKEKEYANGPYSFFSNQDTVEFFKCATKNGIKGFVCPASFVPLLAKGKEKQKLVFVCPGIRQTNDQKNDQVHVATPKKANKFGANYIVVGRPITKASNPLAAYNIIKEEFCSE